jgi:hypothetical protein
MQLKIEQAALHCSNPRNVVPEAHAQAAKHQKERL